MWHLTYSYLKRNWNNFQLVRIRGRTLPSTCTRWDQPCLVCALGTGDSPLPTKGLQEEHMLGTWWVLRAEWINATPYPSIPQGGLDSSTGGRQLSPASNGPRDPPFSLSWAFQLQPCFTVPLPSCGFYQFHLPVSPHLYCLLLSNHLVNIYLI